MDTQIDELVNTINGLADTVLPFLTLAAGAGVTAMAFLQMLKEALYLRAHYHRWRIERWIKKEWHDTDLEALNDIKKLISGERDFGLFALKTEELGQRFRMAARLVIADPNNHTVALRKLVPEEVADQLLAAPEKGKDAGNPSDLAASYADRKIEAMVLSTNHWWRFWHRIAARVLSGMLITYGLSQVEGNWDGVAVFSIVVLGGVVAPIAKDLVTAVEGLRGSR